MPLKVENIKSNYVFCLPKHAKTYKTVKFGFFYTAFDIRLTHYRVSDSQIS